jgi:hypothetical protein
MKKYVHHSPAAITKIILSAALFILVACKEKNVQAPGNAVSQIKSKPPKIDLHAAVLSDNVEAVKQHIAAGSNLNEKDPLGGSSPLISASLFGKTAIAKLLIDAGADLNFRNNDGSTALHTAAFFCRPEIVQLLLKKGADKTIKNKYGSTAYASVDAPFSAVKGTYDVLGKMLSPMGLKLDYVWLEKTRPQIAAMLK